MTRHLPPIDEDVAAAKRAARVMARARRAAIPVSIRKTAATALIGAVADAVADHPGVVAGFWPLENEVDLRPALTALVAAGRTVALPVTGAKREPLTFRRWLPDEPLFAGRFGVMVPGADQPELTPTVVMCPLLAFDDHGGRLGYGGGYYDRTLGLLRAQGAVVAFGVAFAGQLVPHVPTGPFDRPLDGVITEDGFFPNRTGNVLT